MNVYGMICDGILSMIRRTTAQYAVRKIKER
jgi:hypothetical protein